MGNCKDFSDPEEVREYVKKTGSLLFPLYMYDHGGIVLSMDNCRYPFNDPWDAGQLGYILVDREKALKELGKKRMTRKLKKRITEIISAEVDTYNQYLSGEIYGYVIEKENEQIDSCWGFYGIDSVEAEARSVVDYQVGQTIRKHCEKVKDWIRNSVSLIYRSALSIG